MDAESYGFVVEWHDAQADILREYQLTVFAPQRGPLEAAMFDPKAKRSFLKKAPIPDLRLESLHVGGTVRIHARQLKIKSYLNDFTRKALAEQRDSFTLVTAPSAYQGFGRILSAVESSGLTITRLRLVNHNGPVVAMEVIGFDAANQWESAAGSIPPSHVGKISNDEARAYFEDRARFPTTAAFDNCTLCVIRPHAVKSGYAGDIISAIMEEGFELSAAKMVHLHRAEALELLEVYKGVLPYHGEMVDDMGSAPCIALELRSAEDVVEKFRQLCGPHDVDMARHLRPNSLRARFGLDNPQNGVHSTDLPDDAEPEVRYMFEVIDR